jgi:hypothetical protein
MTVQLSLRCLISAGGVVLTVAATGAATAPVSDSIAGPSTCTVTRSTASSSVVCLPGVIPSPTAGPPSAEDLTYQNSVRSHGSGPLGGLL